MTVADFRVRYPEFASTADAVVQLQLDEAAPELDVDRWGVRYDRGLGLLTAHRIALGKQQASDPFFGTGSGSSTTKEVGSVKLSRSVAFSGKKSTADELDLTLYGQQFKSMSMQVGMGAVAI